MQSDRSDEQFNRNFELMWENKEKYILSHPESLVDFGLKPIDCYRVPEKYKDDLEGILITYGQIQDRIEKLGDELAQYYERIKQGTQDPTIYAVILMGGASMFSQQLATKGFRKWPLNEMFIKARSYGSGTVSSGNVKLNLVKKSELQQLDGKDVLIIDDIIDSGNTLYAVKNKLEQYKPRDIKTCCLLDKPMCRKKNVQPDFLGFQIPEMFVVGYCMDYNERYRDLEHIAVLKPKMYIKQDQQ